MMLSFNFCHNQFKILIYVITFQLTALNFILTKSYDFYFDCDSLLDHLGPAPVGNSKVVDENYQQHKALNYKIHEYRKTDDGMIPTLRKVILRRRNSNIFLVVKVKLITNLEFLYLQIKSSFFANDDEYNIFMARTLQVGELRSKVWEKTSKYLVWNHSARGVRANMVKLINETEILSIKHAELLLGRPKNIANSTVKARELDLKLQQLERYGHELKRICKTESIPLVDKRVAAIDMKVQPLILDLMNYNDLAARSEVDKMAVSLKELETEREQLDNMVSAVLTNLLLLKIDS